MGLTLLLTAFLLTASASPTRSSSPSPACGGGSGRGHASLTLSRGDGALLQLENPRAPSLTLPRNRERGSEAFP
jgi:hypothetical protein